MPIDPQAKAFLDRLAAMGGLPLDAMPVDMAREASRALNGIGGAGPELARVENRQIPGPAGEVAVRLYVPGKDTTYPVLVYFHGGGWVIGDLDSHDATCRTLARDAACIVVSVDYRRAPEAKFPAAAEDCYAAARWVQANAAALGGDPQRVAIGGDSAGGNLTAVVALMARDRGGPPLLFQLLVYPVTDAACDTLSYRENADGYLLTRAMMDWFWGHYLPAGADRKNQYHSPLQAASLQGLPAALVITAELDPLRDEGEAYAARLRQAGVPVTMTRYDGMIHGFFGLGAVMNKANAAMDESAAALRKAFAR